MGLEEIGMNLQQIVIRLGIGKMLKLGKCFKSEALEEVRWKCRYVPFFKSL